MSNLETAIALACKVHAGQVDKSGQPYILHPLRLMLKFQSDDERIVAILHDAVEDGDITLDDLRQSGFSEMIVVAIDCLSKRADEGYEDFVSRLSINALARKVKVEDIRDNLDVTRLQSIGPEDLARIAKYHKALSTLLQKNEG